MSCEHTRLPGGVWATWWACHRGCHHQLPSRIPHVTGRGAFGVAGTQPRNQLPACLPALPFGWPSRVVQQAAGVASAPRGLSQETARGQPPPALPPTGRLRGPGRLWPGPALTPGVCSKKHCQLPPGRISPAIRQLSGPAGSTRPAGADRNGRAAPEAAPGPQIPAHCGRPLRAVTTGFVCRGREGCWVDTCKA